MNGNPLGNGLSQPESINMDTQFDGDISNDIAVCGFSLKFPQDATSAEQFWKMILEKRCATTEFPPDRINVDGFHQKGNKTNTVRTLMFTYCCFVLCPC